MNDAQSDAVARQLSAKKPPSEMTPEELRALTNSIIAALKEAVTLRSGVLARVIQNEG